MIAKAKAARHSFSDGGLITRKATVGTASFLKDWFRYTRDIDTKSVGCPPKPCAKAGRKASAGTASFFKILKSLFCAHPDTSTLLSSKHPHARRSLDEGWLKG